MIISVFVLRLQVIKDENYSNYIDVKLNDRPNIVNEDFDIKVTRPIIRTPHRRIARHDALPRDVFQLRLRDVFNQRQRNNGIFFFRQ